MVEAPPWFAFLSCWAWSCAQISYHSCFRVKPPNNILRMHFSTFQYLLVQSWNSLHRSYWHHTLHLILRSVFPFSCPFAQPCSWLANISPCRATQVGQSVLQSLLFFNYLFLCNMRPRAKRSVIMAKSLFSAGLFCEARRAGIRHCSWATPSWWLFGRATVKVFYCMRILKCLAGINSVFLLQHLIRKMEDVTLENLKKWISCSCKWILAYQTFECCLSTLSSISFHH